MAKKRKFRVKVGQHHEGNKVYRAGQVVESDKDLIKAFPEKFEEIGGSSEEDQPQKIVVDGGRSGPSTTPVDESNTTRAGGLEAKAWEDEDETKEGSEKNEAKKEGEKDDESVSRSSASRSAQASRHTPTRRS